MRIMKSVINLRRFNCFPSFRNYCVSYIQGQSPEPKIREYFYYVDHQGMLFLDDARMKNFTSCFKDKIFLEFFFNRLRINESGRYLPHFPYISLCGRERNFVRCDDKPVVFTNVLEAPDCTLKLSYGHAGDVLTVPFQPKCIYVSPNSGRVYHPAPERVGGIGLVRSQLAIEFSQHFIFKPGAREPSKFTWQGITYDLNTDWLPRNL